MSSRWVFFAVLLLAGIFQSSSAPGPKKISRVVPLDHVCLGCLCEALSNCNREIGCMGNVCGLFKISWSYWSDAGRPTLNKHFNRKSHLEYEKCVTDPVCAAITVRNYMGKFSQDCNQDGVIDCMDYAAIHMLGGYNCTVPLNENYVTAITNCNVMVQILSGGYNAGLNLV